MGDEERLKGISIDDLTDEERAGMQRFGEVQMCKGIYPRLVVPAGTKHQLVFHGRKYVGVAISTNGRQNFTTFGDAVEYMMFCDTYVHSRRM